MTNGLNPQAENGHTDIANEIVDMFCHYRISGEEWQVLWVVIRKTYGWHKKDDHISLSQFSDLTGLKRPAVARAINKLLSKKILSVIKKDTSTANMYRFNKHFQEWQVVSKKITASKGSNKKDNRVVTKKIHTKETIQKKINTPLPPFIEKDLWEGYIEMRKKIKAPMTDHAKDLTLKKLEQFKKEGIDPNAALKQSIEKSYRGVFPDKDKRTITPPSKFNEDTQFKCDRCFQVKRKSDREYIGNEQVCKECLKREKESGESFRQNWGKLSDSEKQAKLEQLKKLGVKPKEWMIENGGN